MRRAIAVARTGLGRTAENPSVGCVLVHHGKIVAEARTADGGRPHAEEQALTAAGAQARGATAYLTLEPCAQRSGGTASCADRLIAAGVARVVVASDDASVMAAGQGLEKLRAAGIVVETACLTAEAQALYESYVPRTER
ncbi:MAG: bifunctional diaminohydroxyphosphoribosylaminopyrimidine deaminase/5-amino-6-(5-phosphoribosylamino)uracil reductase RibD [Phenylobacterium sp.]